MEYLKQFKSFEDQADLLIGKGMAANRDGLIEHLRDAGYYRLSGYWNIYKNRATRRFVDGTSFDQVWKIYVFDRQFRLIVLDAVERVEVYIRTQLANSLAGMAGPFGFLSNSNLPRMSPDQYQSFISRCRNAYRRSREPFALHFGEKYGDAHQLPPYWMLVNLMDFGMAVSLYKGAPPKVRKQIAEGLGVTARVLDSWLVTINTIRNICAHHGRLWNRTIGTPPMIPKLEKDPRWHEPVEISGKKIFGSLTVLSYLLSRIAPDSSWRSRLLNEVARLSEEERGRMGFVPDWYECPFWKPWVEMWSAESSRDVRTALNVKDVRLVDD